MNLKAEDSNMRWNDRGFEEPHCEFQDLRHLLSGLPTSAFGLHGNDVLHGRVIDLSEIGALDSSFAEIEVAELEQRVIVPIDRILGICE